MGRDETGRDGTGYMYFVPSKWYPVWFHGFGNMYPQMLVRSWFSRWCKLKRNIICYSFYHGSNEINYHQVKKCSAAKCRKSSLGGTGRYIGSFDLNVSQGELKARYSNHLYATTGRMDGYQRLWIRPINPVITQKLVQNSQQGLMFKLNTHFLNMRFFNCNMHASRSCQHRLLVFELWCRDKK